MDYIGRWRTGFERVSDKISRPDMDLSDCWRMLANAKTAATPSVGMCLRRARSSAGCVFDRLTGLSPRRSRGRASLGQTGRKAGRMLADCVDGIPGEPITRYASRSAVAHAAYAGPAHVGPWLRTTVQSSSHRSLASPPACKGVNAELLAAMLSRSGKCDDVRPDHFVESQLVAFEMSRVQIDFFTRVTFHR
jgi:hypothetical protein